MRAPHTSTLPAHIHRRAPTTGRFHLRSVQMARATRAAMIAKTEMPNIGPPNHFYRGVRFGLG
jgi:hypothetical protein